MAWPPGDADRRKTDEHDQKEVTSDHVPKKSPKVTIELPWGFFLGICRWSASCPPSSPQTSCPPQPTTNALALKEECEYARITCASTTNHEDSDYGPPHSTSFIFFKYRRIIREPSDHQNGNNLAIECVTKRENDLLRIDDDGFQYPLRNLDNQPPE